MKFCTIIFRRFLLLLVCVVYTNHLKAQTNLTKTTPALSQELHYNHFLLGKSALTVDVHEDYSVLKDKLSRKYYVSNIFDIGESDNPFALPIEGRKNKNPKTQKKEIQQVFKDLFESNHQSTSKHPQWLIFWLLGLLSYMSILFSIFPKAIKLFFHAFMSNAAARNIQREYQSLFKIENLACYLLFVLSMAPFCFMLPQLFNDNYSNNSFGMLLLCVAGISIAYTLKHLQLHLIAFIFPFSQEVNFYNFAVANTNKVLAFLLPPILFILIYVPSPVQLTVLYAILSFLGIMYAYRSFSAIISAGTLIIFHKFHFIVYLCAVEIAPILISLKLLSIL